MKQVICATSWGFMQSTKGIFKMPCKTSMRLAITSNNANVTLIRSWFRKALEVYQSTDLEVNAAVCRTKYRLSKLLMAQDLQDEARTMRQQAGQMRQAINGIPINLSDNIESYESLVPYWGR
jgi:hypothetical protein